MRIERTCGATWRRYFSFRNTTTGPTSTQTVYNSNRAFQRALTCLHWLSISGDIQITNEGTTKVPRRYHEGKRSKSCTPAVRSTSQDVQLVLHVEAFRMRHHMPRSDEYWPSYGYSKMDLKRQFEFFFSGACLNHCPSSSDLLGAVR